MSRTHTVVPSPIGPLTVVREDGALVRLAMSPPGRFVDAEIGERSDDGFDDVVRQLGEYFAGERTAFDLPLRPRGSDFELAVWHQLTRIPYGETRSYGDVADDIACRAPRAVGQANRNNPIPIVIPCHRVTAAGGGIGGYAGQWEKGEGMDRKRWLLKHEGAAGF